MDNVLCFFLVSCFVINPDAPVKGSLTLGFDQLRL